MMSDTKPTAAGATYTKTQANSTSPPPESNGRCPGPGSGEKTEESFQLDFAYPSFLG